MIKTLRELKEEINLLEEESLDYDLNVFIADLGENGATYAIEFIRDSTINKSVSLMCLEV